MDAISSQSFVGSFLCNKGVDDDEVLTLGTLRERAVVCGAVVAIGASAHVDGARNAEAQAVACTFGCIQTQTRALDWNSSIVAAYTSSQAFSMKGVSSSQLSPIPNGGTNGKSACNGASRCIKSSLNDGGAREGINFGTGCTVPRPLPHMVCGQK